MRRTLIAVAMLAMSLHAHGQGSPEERAIVEALTAKDAAAVEKHLPKALSDALDSTDRATREQFLSRPRSIMEMKDLKIAQANDSRALVAFDVTSPDADIKHFELITVKRISDGADAVLLIACVAPEKNWGPAEVWMHFEDGEWRITELSDPQGGGTIDLDDLELVAQLTHNAQYANEMQAIGNLRMIVTALVSYGATFGEVPQRLETLGGDQEEETTSEHAHLLDPNLASTRVRSGYKFEYERTSLDTFTLTANPLDFGKSGTRNFFADESGVIRFTSEDRAATVNDPALK